MWNGDAKDQGAFDTGVHLGLKSRGDDFVLIKQGATKAFLKAVSGVVSNLAYRKPKGCADLIFERHNQGGYVVALSRTTPPDHGDDAFVDQAGIHRQLKVTVGAETFRSLLAA